MQTISDTTFPEPQAGSRRGERWLVMKFGGTSVSSAARWSVVRDLITERQAAGYRPVIVHSALAGVSNRLEALLEAAVAGQHEAALASVAELHADLARELGIAETAGLDNYVAELGQLLAGVRLVREVSPRVQAKVLAFGELMATRLGAQYLASQGVETQWLDVRDYMTSAELPHENERSRYLSATCDFEPDERLQEQLARYSGVLVTQGFIASNAQGESVLLGRGGSDTSAAYFAARLQACGLEIWTDVPGLFSANPRTVPGARLLNALSFEEAQEIASTGGSVLHPRCIRPVRRFGIPLRVRSALQPEYEGTLVSNDPGSNAPGVTAISGRQGVTVVSMETVGMWREVGFLAEAFRCFSELGLSVDLVSTAESNVTVTLDTGTQSYDVPTLNRLRASLERICRVKIIEGTEVVSLVGRKIRAMLHEIGPAMEVFQEHRIHLVSQAASDLNLSFVVEEGQAHRLIQELHAILVQPAADDAVFGPAWTTLQEPVRQPEKAREPWWRTRRARLLELASSHGSAYVYDLQSVRHACECLRSLANVDAIFFAIKANSHPGILTAVGEAGVNFECVSPGELRRVLDVFPDIDPQRVLFTPNFAPREEYELAHRLGVRITLDNLHPLRHWGSLFQDREVILRLDTGQGRGHHEHVRTAGVQSKFGIPLFELEEAQELASEAGVIVAGLHAHSGSGILQADNWQGIAAVLAEAATRFPDVRILNLGGGLGVPEKPGQRPLDMAALDDSLGPIKATHRDRELWLEPGRYIVAEAGVLLATVTQIKGKGEVRYVGVSTGMNSLIRPALYGAYHEIVNLTRLDEPAAAVVTIVGPNCESGDRLGNDRLLPSCEEGDVLLIANAGAYGYVMSSRYNLREPAVEHTI